MFSLIITLVSIALVVALAVASLYYGGSIMGEANTRAKAGAYITQGQQVLAAAQMFRGERGRWPSNVDELVQERYLSGVPHTAQNAPEFSLISAAYAAPSEWANVKLPWAAVVPGVPQYWMKKTVPKSVCQSINKQARGDNAIYAEAIVGMQTQCFGAAEPYTALIYAEATDLPAGSTIIETLPLADPELHAILPSGTPTIVVPSTGDTTFVGTDIWATSPTAGTTVSSHTSGAGISVWGLLITPSNSTVPLYIPTSSQPLPTPPGWTPANTSAQGIHPIAPNTNSDIWVWPGIAPYPAGSGGFPKLYHTIDETGQLACDTLEANHKKAGANVGPLTYTGYVSNSYYNCYGNWYGTIGNVSASSADVRELCPTGYSLSSSSPQPKCSPTSPTSVPKPSDGVCHYYRTPPFSNMEKDLRDPDCTTGPATGSQAGVKGKRGPNYCGSSEPSEGVVKVNADGKITITQYYGSCGGQVTKTCNSTSTNAPGYYQAAQMGPMVCN